MSLTFRFVLFVQDVDSVRDARVPGPRNHSGNHYICRRDDRGVPPLLLTCVWFSLQSKGHGKSVDWWALGILVFEMLAGYPPFFDDSPYGIYQKILGGKIDFPRHFDVKAKDLIRRLLTADKSKRLGCLRAGAEDIKQHKWFSRTNWDAVFKCAVAAPFVPSVSAPASHLPNSLPPHDTPHLLPYR